MTYYSNAVTAVDVPRKRQNALNGLRTEMTGVVVRISDADLIRSTPRTRLFEQVSFILGEILRKYTFVLSDCEVRDMALSLSTDIKPTAREERRQYREKLRHRTII